MIGAIAGRELKSLFLSPLAWIILAAVTGITAWIFLIQLDQFLNLQAQLARRESPPGATDIVVVPLFNLLGILLLMVLPLLTMRLISEERRNGTLPLLLSSPLGAGSIVLGKFLAMLAFSALVTASAVLMGLSLYAGTRPDLGQITSAACGLLLLASAFSAIGLYISSLTRQPGIAAVATFGVLFMLWIVHWAGQTGESGQEILAWLSITRHQQSFQLGLLNSGDIAYYLIVTLLFLLFGIRRLEMERLQG
ncbi:MAG TPA: ABC transporter permease [Gammaproteobacteria bacterium]|nr:ABC transporter permease [Gammaproteobacteria bacterium]